MIPKTIHQAWTDFNKHHLYLLIFALLIGVGFRIILSFLSIYNLPVSSDEAISQLLAESINTGQHYPLLFTGQPYQFPIEAYVMSLFVNIFDNGSMSARLPLILINLSSLVILCMATVNVIENKNRWPTLLLLFIPSAYWLLHQSAYFVPQYTVAAFLSAVLIYLVIKVNQSKSSSLFLSLMTGVISGLVLSNHLLTLSIVAASFLVFIFSGNVKRGLIRGLVFMAGLLLGLLPYFLAIIYIEGAYDAITNRIDLSIVFERLYNVVISQALPGAMGVYPPYYPDYPVHIEWGLPLRLFMVASFLVVLAFIFILRLKHFVSNIIRRKWPDLAWPDMFLIITIVSIFLMAINTRSGPLDHRYLLPVVWSFPFLVGFLYSILGSIGRRLIDIYLFALITINIFTTIDLLSEWNQPEKIQHHADIADISPIINWLEINEISYCYATFWLAYRFTYETNKDIICSPVHNERFNGWPIPYKDLVNQQQNVAFVMSNTYGSKFHSRRFEQIMIQYDVAYQRVFFDPYYVYHEFEYAAAIGEKTLSPDLFDISTNIDDVDVSQLVDGEVMKSWEMKATQHSGQVIDFFFKKEQYLQKVELVHQRNDPYQAMAVKIWGLKNGQWLELTDSVEANVDQMRYDFHHPIFGEYAQAIRFQPQWLEAVRVELETPLENKPWSLSEIRLGVQTNQ